MAVISGRYGAVKRILPVSWDAAGKPIWPAPSGGYDNFTQDKSGRKSAVSDVSEVIPELMPASISADGLDNGSHQIVSSVTSWSMENTVNSVEYIASNTRGYKGALEGLHSCTGSFSGLGGCPPIAPGQRFKFTGFVGPKNSTIDSEEGQVYQVAAVANSVQIQINYGMSNPITWTVQWQSDFQSVGDELQVSQSGFWDYSIPPVSTMMPSNTANLVVYNWDEASQSWKPFGWDGRADSAVDALCLLDANINFNTDISQFANSCSAVAGGWQSCVVGATSCDITANIHGDHYSIVRDILYSTNAKMHLPGVNHRIKLYVQGGTVPENSGVELANWDFDAMFFGTFGGLNVDMTSNNPLQFSCQMKYNAYPNGRQGYIRYTPPYETVVDDQGHTQYVQTPFDFVNMNPLS